MKFIMPKKAKAHILTEREFIAVNMIKLPTA